MKDLDILCRNAVDVIDRADLEARLKEGKPLRVKAGFDPSAPDIHLGHTVLLRKLREFQDLGHKVILIIGDFTAMIGDPSGRTKTRPALADKDIAANAKTYQAQAFKILDKDPKKIEVVRNSEWLGKLSMNEFLKDLAARAMVARILERDDFEKRMKENQPLSVLEMLYPLFQGYDSVAVKADVELGGTDQKFNLLMGREFQRDFKQRPQIVMTFPLLVGLDGTMKMSKSLGNYIGVTDSAKDVFGKAMSIPDTLMASYYSLLTSETFDSSAHPRDAKVKLAKLLTESLHSKKEAEAQAAEFTRVFSNKENPENPDIRHVPYISVGSANLLCNLSVAKSSSDAYRLIQQGAVTLDGQKVIDPKSELKIKESGSLLKVGKKIFLKLVPKK